MSARKRILRYVEESQSFTDPPVDPETGFFVDSKVHVGALLDAFAHELAEEIRAETRALKRYGVLEPDKYRPCRDAADQIDPEVSSNG